MFAPLLVLFRMLAFYLGTTLTFFALSYFLSLPKAGRAKAAEELPPQVRAQVDGSPTLQNLARVLAYQKRQLHQMPLVPAETAKLQLAGADLVEALRTILCL